MTDQQTPADQQTAANQEAPAPADPQLDSKPDVRPDAKPDPASDLTPGPKAPDFTPSAPIQPWASPEVMSLGAVGAVGLLAFAVVFGLVLDRGSATPRGMAPQTAFQPVAANAGASSGLRGEPGARGERGPPGPAGDPGIRIVRQDCNVSTCSVKCGDDEVMLTAHCGVARVPAVFPTERTALCRTVNSGKVDVVGACVRMTPR